MTYAPDGKTVATGEHDGTVRLRDAASGKLHFSLPGQGEPVHSVAFSPDGKTLLTASTDRGVKMWDVATGQERATLGTPADGVTCAALSADGSIVAAGCKKQQRQAVGHRRQGEARSGKVTPAPSTP